MLDWLNPSEVRYSTDQIMWILNNALEGWPTEESNYTDAPVSQSSSNHMPGETIMLVMAELDTRLDMCNAPTKYGVNAGDRLRDYFLGLYNDEDGVIIDFRGLTPEQRSTVLYCAGKCRRWVSCENCHQHPVEMRKSWNYVILCLLFPLAPLFVRVTGICRSAGRKPCTFNQYIGHHR